MQASSTLHFSVSGGLVPASIIELMIVTAAGPIIIVVAIEIGD